MQCFSKCAVRSVTLCRKQYRPPSSGCGPRIMIHVFAQCLGKRQRLFWLCPRVVFNSTYFPTVGCGIDSDRVIRTLDSFGKPWTDISVHGACCKAGKALGVIREDTIAQGQAGCLVNIPRLASGQSFNSCEPSQCNKPSADFGTQVVIQHGSEVYFVEPAKDSGGLDHAQ